jgi:hypothetical protein
MLGPEAVRAVGYVAGMLAAAWRGVARALLQTYGIERHAIIRR